MTCYMISQGGEPVAVVASLEMARAIVHCQPWGEYLVEPMEVEDLPSGREPEASGPPLRHRFARARRGTPLRSGRWNPGISPGGINHVMPQAR